MPPQDREVRGIMSFCCRCNTAVFRKYIGQGERDGGFTKWDKYEDLPDGWLYETEFGYLCPECAHKFKAFMTYFLGTKVVPKWRL